MKTGWYPGDVRPARPGMYEVQDHTLTCNCCWMDMMWDGKEWFSDVCTPSRYRTHHFAPLRRWRGLAARAAHGKGGQG